jgi:glycerophosphoryl diester phosphodiesterase
VAPWTGRAPVGRPLVFAHRGGSALRPENTLAAFDNGLALGADGLELDVHLSRDGEVVVHHDAVLDRTTSEQGRLADRTAEELARIDAGYRFRPLDAAGKQEFPYRGCGIAIPTLACVLDRYPAVRIIIELKTASEALVRRTVEVVRHAGAADRVSIGSFSTRAIRLTRRLAPEIRTGAAREETRWALYRSWVGWPPGRPAYAEFHVPERSGRTRVVSRRFVEAAHRAGVAVNVWTVDDEADMIRLLDWGVDGLISDRPDIAVAVVRARQPGRPDLEVEPTGRGSRPS